LPVFTYSFAISSVKNIDESESSGSYFLTSRMLEEESNFSSIIAAISELLSLIKITGTFPLEPPPPKILPNITIKTAGTINVNETAGLSLKKRIKSFLNN